MLLDFAKKPFRDLAARVRRLEDQMERQLVLQGRGLTRTLLQQGRLDCLADAEFSVFSQWGEDGIIQYLLSRTETGSKSFIEFGVETYHEANTRFLLLKDNWRGLVIDGSPRNIAAIRSQNLAWRHQLDAVASFITRENINQLFTAAGYTGDVGLLSIDIDGNDYWIWDSIEVVSPRIVIAEYNGLWGSAAEVSVPYDPSFVRTGKHFSNLYWGASLGAFVYLGGKKGYTFVGSNSTGLNAFFVRNDVLGDLKAVDPQAGFVERKFREGRTQAGELTFDNQEKQAQVVGHLPLVDVRSGRTGRAAELVGGKGDAPALGGPDGSI